MQEKDNQEKQETRKAMEELTIDELNTVTGGGRKKPWEIIRFPDDKKKKMIYVKSK